MNLKAQAHAWALGENKQDGFSEIFGLTSHVTERLTS